jgi:orotate phosphoribosyltransferase
VSGSQLFFRDNTSPMIRGKSVLILAASVVSGYPAESAAEAIHYYDGRTVGICSIFAKISECVGLPVHSVFNPDDLTDYRSGPALTCPMCANGEKITALVNSFGISAI